MKDVHSRPALSRCPFRLLRLPASDIEPVMHDGVDFDTTFVLFQFRFQSLPHHRSDDEQTHIDSQADTSSFVVSQLGPVIIPHLSFPSRQCQEMRKQERMLKVGQRVEETILKEALSSARIGALLDEREMTRSRRKKAAKGRERRRSL